MNSIDLSLNNKKTMKGQIDLNLLVEAISVNDNRAGLKAGEPL